MIEEGMLKTFIPKILIVDDQSTHRDCLKNILISVLHELGLHCEILEGSDGNDIISLLQEHDEQNRDIKLVFTDECMEKINGSDAIRQIRNYEKAKQRNKRIIISVTSDTESEMTNKITSSGANYVLAKPLAKSVMKDLIINLMGFLTEQ